MVGKKSRPRNLADICEAALLFNSEAAAAIIAEVGIPPLLDRDFLPDHMKGREGEIATEDALAWHLGDLSQRFRWSERAQYLPTKSEIEKATRKIALLCRQLHGVLTDEGGAVRDGIGAGYLFAYAALDGEESGAGKVQGVADDIARLEAWAIQSADRAASQDAGGRGRGRKRDHAFHEMLDQLGGIYFIYWRRRPGRSYNEVTGEEGGPYFRFAAAVVRKLLPEWSADGDIAGALGGAIAEHTWPQDLWGKLDI